MIVSEPEVLVRLGDEACTWIIVTDCGGGGGGGGGGLEEDPPPPHALKNANRKMVKLQIALAHASSNRPVPRFVPRRAASSSASTITIPAKYCALAGTRDNGVNRR